MLFKGCSVVAEFVQEHTQGPYIRLLVDRTPQVDVDHLGSTILEGSMSIEIGFEHPELLSVSRHFLHWSSTAKVA